MYLIDYGFICFDLGYVLVIVIILFIIMISVNLIV